MCRFIFPSLLFIENYPNLHFGMSAQPQNAYS